MSTLRLAVANADENTRRRAVDALHDAGIEVTHAQIDDRPSNEAPAAEPSRDPTIITLGAGLMGIFGALGAWMAVMGGWWIAPAVVVSLVSLFGACGMAYGLQRTNRPRKTTQEKT